MPAPLALRWVQVESRSAHTFAVRSDGRLYGWGKNDSGVLGPNTGSSIVAQPKVIDGLPLVAQVASSPWHACALTREGTVWCWGRAFGGCLGTGSMKSANFVPPAPIAGLTEVSGVAASGGSPFGANTCAWQKNGQVLCWGAWPANAYAKPRLIAQLGTARSVSLGDMGACAPQLNDAVQCWGFVPGTEPELKIHFPDGPLRRAPPTARATLGSGRACVLTSTGNVGCWGSTVARQLAEVPTVSAALFPAPQMAPYLEGVADFALAPGASCVVSRAGALRCWGDNSHGRLGFADEKLHDEPAQRLGLPAVAQVTLGDDHGCALTREGTLYCWGGNEVGQVGVGTPSSTRVASSIVSVE